MPELEITPFVRIVKTQSEFDAAYEEQKADWRVRLVVAEGDPTFVARENSQPSVEAWGNSQPSVVARGNSQPRVVARGNSQPRVVARENSQPRVVARENSQPSVEAWGNSQPSVEAWGNSQPSVVARENSQPSVEAWGNSQPSVVARENSQPRVEARENSQPRVEARENSQPRVEARENSQPSVEARENSQPRVVARENSQPRVGPLRHVVADLWMILALARKEVPGLLNAIREGKIDGSTYEGSCACLVGTVANVRGCKHTEIPGLMPNAERPAERWFVNLRPGMKPETHTVSATTEEWVLDWMRLQPEAETEWSEIPGIRLDAKPEEGAK